LFDAIENFVITYVSHKFFKKRGQFGAFTFRLVFLGAPFMGEFGDDFFDDSTTWTGVDTITVTFLRHLWKACILYGVDEQNRHEDKEQKVFHEKEKT
jgi:hypothetical protein